MKTPDHFFNLFWDFLGFEDDKAQTSLDTRKNDYILRENQIIILPVMRERYRFYSPELSRQEKNGYTENHVTRARLHM